MRKLHDPHLLEAMLTEITKLLKGVARNVCSIDRRLKFLERNALTPLLQKVGIEKARKDEECQTTLQLARDPEVNVVQDTTTRIA